MILVERPIEWWAERAKGADEGCVTAGGRGKGTTLWDRLQHGVSFLKASAPDPAAVDGMSPAAVFKAMADRVLVLRRELEDAELRRMLGGWVSEMEPWLVRRHDWRIAGLTIRGACNPDGTAPPLRAVQVRRPGGPMGQEGGRR